MTDALRKMEEEYKEVLNAVERGEESAKTKLAWYKLSGMGGAKVDVDGAVKLLEERVKDRDGEAMWMLGLCKEYGRGIEQDISGAERLYEQSKAFGNDVGKILSRNVGDRKQRIELKGLWNVEQHY